MQAMNQFEEHYVEPVVYPPTSQAIFRMGEEVVKIIAAKIFLEYLGQSFLNHPKVISKEDVHTATVIAPIGEEIVFRCFILGGIRTVQRILNAFEKKESEDIEKGEEVDSWSKKSFFYIRLGSNFYDNSPQDLKEDDFVITLYPPITEEMLVRIYMRIIDPWGGEHSGLTKEELKERCQQIFRIHLAALIFAAAHLGNHHPTKADALIQFTWTYIGGIIYGYLSEKYGSLVPGIIAHGFNNSIATAAQIYPEASPFLLLALLVNRVAFYVLATTFINKGTNHSEAQPETEMELDSELLIEVD